MDQTFHDLCRERSLAGQALFSFVNLMYLAVLAVGFVGAFLAHFQPRGMALTLFATAVAQMLVPVIALVIWKAGGHDLWIDPHSPNPPFDPCIGPVFGLNAVFAMLWVVSGRH